MDWATIVLDVLTLLIVIASFLAIRDNRNQTKTALAEGRTQSQAALALAHEQIEQDKQPILIPLSPLPLTAVVGELDSTVPELSVDLMNVGTGVALNIWGVIATPESFSRRPFSFSNEAFLLQSEHRTIKLDMHRIDFFAEDYKFGEYNLWPSSELTELSQGGTGKKLMYAVRLTLTYMDVFGIKHATIYDCTSENKWKFVKHFPIKYDLEDLYKDKKS